MIYTQYGNEVEIIDGDINAMITARRIADGATRDYHISQIAADGGIKEIEKALQKAKGK